MRRIRNRNLALTTIYRAVSTRLAERETSVTMEALEQRARNAIERKESVAYDVAESYNQILDNVAEMIWFRRAVMHEIANTTQRWERLRLRIPQIFEP